VINFVKMHGIANDYIYIDVVSEPALEGRFDGDAGRDLVRRMSDRHRGVGSDGVILVARPHPGIDADVRMRMFNADGSESEMCGNGVRCVAKFAHDRLGIEASPMRVQTGRGVLPITYRVHDGEVTEATVDMGEPIFALGRIPVREDRLSWDARDNHCAVEAMDRCFVMTFVSMGNPHAVIFENGREPFTPDRVRDYDLWRIGPALEKHPAFPQRINVHIAAPQGRAETTMRTWERGAGLTQACGTGACAVVAAGIRTGRFDRDVLVHLPGGDLRIRWDDPTGHILMTGPADDAFEGVWPE
jgi:diaminopimelate epimerase